MTILCVIASLCQLTILMTLTGILVSIAAVSRLMELTIILIQPVTIFMLRQSGNLIVWSVGQTAGSTSHAFRKICGMERAEQGGGDTSLTTPTDPSAIEVNMRTPDVPYARSAFPGLVEEKDPLVDCGESEVSCPDDGPCPNKDDDGGCYK